MPSLALVLKHVELRGVLLLTTELPLLKPPASTCSLCLFSIHHLGWELQWRILHHPAFARTSQWPLAHRRSGQSISIPGQLTLFQSVCWHRTKIHLWWLQGSGPSSAFISHTSNYPSRWLSFVRIFQFWTMRTTSQVCLFYGEHLESKFLDWYQFKSINTRY